MSDSQKGHHRLILRHSHFLSTGDARFESGFVYPRGAFSPPKIEVFEVPDSPGDSASDHGLRALALTEPHAPRTAHLCLLLLDIWSHEAKIGPSPAVEMSFPHARYVRRVSEACMLLRSSSPNLDRASFLCPRGKRCHGTMQW